MSLSSFFMAFAPMLLAWGPVTAVGDALARDRMERPKVLQVARARPIVRTSCRRKRYILM